MNVRLTQVLRIYVYSRGLNKKLTFNILKCSYLKGQSNKPTWATLGGLKGQSNKPTWATLGGLKYFQFCLRFRQVSDCEIDSMGVWNPAGRLTPWGLIPRSMRPYGRLTHRVSYPNESCFGWFCVICTLGIQICVLKILITSGILNQNWNFLIGSSGAVFKYEKLQYKCNCTQNCTKRHYFDSTYCLTPPPSSDTEFFLKNVFV